ncbi:hypothetical protein [Nocardiopsis quinghaiensis]|uniref:hypothetical protein n=1 Tax=Nocardiopsis quinghaiensis TaxID=464995 RepID=UPI001680C06F|nr:hypothetical protein [Nocardiopsis quinghaiensis]
MPTPPGQIPSPSVSPDPIDTLAAVRGRILLHVKDITKAPLRQVSHSISGVVFSGKRALANQEWFTRSINTECPTLVDPSSYEEHYATPERPFYDEDPPPLFEIPAPRPGSPRVAPRHLRLTSTRYLNCDPTGEAALRTAVARVNTTNDPALVLAIPVDVRWLDERRDLLVSLLREARPPKALILGYNGNPVEHAGRAGKLREIISHCPETALVRTDLAAVDVMVHGAAFAAIGDSSSVRHTVPRSRRGGGNASDSSPNVLYEPLLDYFRGSTLARYLDEKARECTCSACSRWADDHHRSSGGRTPTSFVDPADIRNTHAHNMAMWSRLWADISAEPTPKGLVAIGSDSARTRSTSSAGTTEGFPSTRRSSRSQNTYDSGPDSATDHTARRIRPRGPGRVPSLLAYPCEDPLSELPVQRRDGLPDLGARRHQDPHVLTPDIGEPHTVVISLQTGVVGLPGGNTRQRHAWGYGAQRTASAECGTPIPALGDE